MEKIKEILTDIDEKNNRQIIRIQMQQLQQNRKLLQSKTSNNIPPTKELDMLWVMLANTNICFIIMMQTCLAWITPLRATTSSTKQSWKKYGFKLTIEPKVVPPVVCL